MVASVHKRRVARIEQRELKALREENNRLREENKAQSAEIRTLGQKIAKLEKKLDSLDSELRAAKRQATPFGGRKKKRKPKKPGRRKGEGSFQRRQAPPEEETTTVEVPLAGRCPDCRVDLEDWQEHVNIQTDLPKQEPVNTRFITQSGKCPCCKKRFRSRHPEQASTAGGAAHVGIGPHAKAVAADLHHRLGISYEKIADHLEATAGLHVTASALCQTSQRLANHIEPVYQELVHAIRDCCAIHADETGWRIGTLSAWLWVFASKQITVYRIAQSRGHEVVIEVLGCEFKGVLVSDCFLAYDHKALKDWLKQKCFAHFLRKLSEMEDQKTQGAVRFARDVSAVLRQALELEKERPQISSLAFRRRLNKIERRLDELIAEDRKFSDEDNRRFAKRLRKHRKHLFSFLEYAEVPADNNLAERRLRPAVIIRKTGACNKTEKGAFAHSRIASILQTAKQQGLNTISVIAKLITGKPDPKVLVGDT